MRQFQIPRDDNYYILVSKQFEKVIINSLIEIIFEIHVNIKDLIQKILLLALR